MEALLLVRLVLVWIALTQEQVLVDGPPEQQLTATDCVMCTAVYCCVCAEDPEYELEPCRRLAKIGETACKEVRQLSPGL